MAQTVYNPIVIDLGKVRRKRIKQLKRNRGKLVAEVQEVMDRVRADLGEEAKGQRLVPVILCYRRKRRRRKRRRGGGLLPFQIC